MRHRLLLLCLVLALWPGLAAAQSPDTEHGFAFPQRPVYRKHAAEGHWERLHALFDRCLRA